MQGRGKGPEAELAALRVDEFVKAQRVTKPFLHQQRGVENEIVSGDDVQLGQLPLQPTRQETVVAALMGNDERFVPQILRLDRLFLRQRRVPAHEHAP